jgi:large subunit ribosomal protein L3
MVEHAAEHEIDTGPTTEEAEALLAEQHAGAPTEASRPAENNEAEGNTPDADANKEG